MLLQISKNSIKAETQVVQNKPFYQVKGLSIVIFLVQALVVFYIIKQVIKRKRARKMLAIEHARKIAEERTRIAEEMHDDIGADLNNLLFKIRMNENFTNPNNAAAINQLENTTKAIILKVDEVIWALNAQKDTLDSLVNFIIKYVTELTDNTALDCNYNIPLNLPAIEIAEDTRRNIFLTVKEILHNATEHAQATELKLDIAYTNKQLSICISDNGKGFDMQHIIKGNGLGSLQNRVSKMNGTISIVSEIGKGTTISFEVRL